MAFSSTLRPMNRLTLALLAILPALSAAADWTQFRGPDGSGSIPDAVLPTALEPRKHITWELPLPGRGLASPVIVGDRVFVTSSSGPKQARLRVDDEFDGQSGQNG